MHCQPVSVPASYVIRNRPEAVRKRMSAVPLESQAISVVTYAEVHVRRPELTTGGKLR